MAPDRGPRGQPPNAPHRAATVLHEPRPMRLSALLTRARERGLLAPTTLAFVALLGVYLFRFARFSGSVVHGDAHYSWIIARSLVFDRDLHFANDYALCGDPWHVGVDEGGGRPANPFYLGPALLWAPLLAVLRAVVPVATGASASLAAGCFGPWVKGTLALAPILGAVTVWLGGRVARRFVDDSAAAVAMLTVGLGTTLLHFASLVPAYSHTYAALGVAVALLGWIRAREAPSIARYFLAGLGVGFAALMRAQGGLMLLPVALTLLGALLATRGAQDPWPARRAAIVQGLVALVGFVAVFGVQLVVYKKLYGHWWVVPQGRAYLQLAHAHPWLVLFAARGGLFSWTPLVWLAVGGFVLLLVRPAHRGLTGALLVALVLDHYVNSAPIDWHGNASFGARRLTALAAALVLPTGVFLRALFDWITRTRARTAAALVLLGMGPWWVINAGASRANIGGQIPFDGPVPMPRLYGDGLRHGLEAVYERLGNPFVLPAVVVFRLRYGLGPASFDRLATGGYFEHDYRPVRLKGCDTVQFADASHDAVLVEGLRRDAQGVVLEGGRPGRFLLPLAWFSVTHLAVEGESLGAGAGAGEVPVTVRVGSFFRRRMAGTVRLGASAGVHEMAVDPRAFSSGINEVIVEAPGRVRLRTLRFIDRRVHDTRLFGR